MKYFVSHKVIKYGTEGWGVFDLQGLTSDSIRVAAVDIAATVVKETGKPCTWTEVTLISITKMDEK